LQNPLATRNKLRPEALPPIGEGVFVSIQIRSALGDIMKTISSPNAPKAIGPYSQAVSCGGFLFCSGQIPLDPVTMEMVGTNIEEQSEQVFKNIKAVLKEAGVSIDKVIKTTVFLKNFDDFVKMNALYESHFGNHRPARSTVEVSRLPRNALIEVECVVSLIS
jgi:2-iminobutanoate/2-iminopropanoate deaminase